MSRLERNLLLAVDDEVDFLELIVQVGEGVGCDVITANSAEAFREQLSSRQPALILLDLQMPGMDGIEALRYLGRYEAAIELATRNLAYLQARGPSFGLDVARQQVNLGLVYWRRGDLEQAIDCFKEAQEYGEREGIRELAATAAMNVGLVLDELGRYGEALEVDRFAAREFRELDARERLATAEMNLGLLHISRGEYGQALEIFRGILEKEPGHAAAKAGADADA